MSNHFTYEVNERNLRIQMKDFTVPVNEDAWQKFETFSDTMVSQHRENRLKNFNFSLNRSVVLPSVFGVIIILFSFLLVNFVSIKNPVRTSEQKAEAVPVKPAPQAQPKTEQQVPVIAEKPKVDDAAVTTPTVADIQPEEKAIMNALVTTPETVPAETITPSAETSTDIASASEAKAKRRAERRAARALEAQKIQEIRPTPVSEERDTDEIRPD